MADGNSHQTTFTERFDTLAPLIRDEWPQVAADALEKTKGNYDRVVALIATETEHSRTLVKKQLQELAKVASNAASKDEVVKLRKMVERLQAKSQDVAKYVQKQMMTDARETVGKNPLVALLMAVGFGIILGFILRGLGRGRR